MKRTDLRKALWLAQRLECPSADELAAYRSDELTSLRSAEILHHVVSCRHCTRTLFGPTLGLEANSHGPWMATARDGRRPRVR